jgi:hypothetical protein
MITHEQGKALRRVLAGAPAEVQALMAAQAYAEVAAALNAPGAALPNPAAQADVPVPVTWQMVVKALRPAEVLAVYQVPGLREDFTAALAEGDAELVALYQAILGEMVSAGSAAAVAGLFGRTQPDPTWTPTVAGPSLAAAAGLGWVTAQDVAFVDPGNRLLGAEIEAELAAELVAGGKG